MNKKSSKSKSNKSKSSKKDNIKETMQRVIYFWYYHLYEDARDEIQYAINAKDFTAFKKAAKKWNNMKQENGETWEFCPQYASIFDENDEIIGEVDVFTKKGFMSITGNDYECG